MIELWGIYSQRPDLSASARNWLGNFEIENQCGKSERQQFQSSDTRSIAVRTGDDGQLVRIEHEIFALAGSPIWRDERMAEQSCDQGNAATFADGWTRLGEGVFDLMSGGFAATVLNMLQPRAVLAIDRMGIGRLAYTKIGHEFVFSHSVDAIAQFPGARPELRKQSIYDYFFFHQIPSPHSIYRGIDKLEPGQLIESDANQTKCHRYWTPSFSSPVSQNRPSHAELIETFRYSIERNMSDAGKVGTYLSGGLDSSTVSAIANQNANTPITAYTIGFDVSDFDEMQYAKIVSDHFSLRHKTYYVTSGDIVSSLPHIVKSCDEPFGNASIIPTYFCGQLAASDGTTTLLAGDGGDELFGGNERYAKERLFEYFWRLPEPAMQLLTKFATYADHAPFGMLSKFSSYISQARIPLPDRLESYNFLTRNPQSQLFEERFLEEINTLAPFELMRSEYAESAEMETLDRLLLLDWKFTLADNDLRKVQTASDLADITTKYPLLDLDIVDLSLRLPVTDKLKGNNLRPFFRNATQPLLPKQTITKHKHGFGLPFGIWMKSDPQLNAVANDSVNEFRKRKIFRPTFLKWLHEKHESDHATYYGNIIWAIVVLEQWLAARNL